MNQAGNTVEASAPGLELLAAELRKLVTSETAVRCREPLAKRTTLRVGGPADLFVEPASEADLGVAVRFCRARQLPLFVLGRGSNLLVKDRGFRGLVVSLGQPGFSRIEMADARVRCGAGARLKAVAVEAKRRGLAGLEFLEGIPGSVGGALRMNAGAMGGAIFDAVESVRLMDFEGNARELAVADVQVVYRDCLTLRTHIALGAVLQGRPGSREQIEQRMNQFSRKRWQSQPSAPSAGCTFKNPATIPAGKLIEELGLKGTRVGGASISAEHGNFIINDGAATAQDILGLMDLIRQRVRQDRQIELETEIEIIGE
jgi:UDP-N-acetylenolpyruvoylglucosamine reductase